MRVKERNRRKCEKNESEIRQEPKQEREKTKKSK